MINFFEQKITKAEQWLPVMAPFYLTMEIAAKFTAWCEHATAETLID